MLSGCAVDERSLTLKGSSDFAIYFSYYFHKNFILTQTLTFRVDPPSFSPAIQTTADGRITFVMQAQGYVGVTPANGVFTPFATTADVTSALSTSTSTLQSQVNGLR